MTKSALSAVTRAHIAPALSVALRFLWRRPGKPGVPEESTQVRDRPFARLSRIDGRFAGPAFAELLEAFPQAAPPDAQRALAELERPWRCLQEVPRQGAIDRGLHADQVWSVADHSALLFVLTLRLGRQAGLTEEQLGLALEYCLVHDMPEIVTGDITPQHPAGLWDNGKDAAERRGWEELSRSLAPAVRAYWTGRWEAYQENVGLPAAFVKQLDKLAGLLELLDYARRYSQLKSLFLETVRHERRRQWAYAREQVTRARIQFQSLTSLLEPLETAREVLASVRP